MTQTTRPDPNFPMALFVHGGAELVDGTPVTSCVVHTPEALEAAQAEGWHRSAPEALAAHEAAEAEAEAKRQAEVAEKAAQAEGKAPTRPELEQKATELGIKFKPQTSNKQLLADIEAKLAAKNE